MRTEIILFTPQEMGIWELEAVLDIPDQLAKMLKGEFFGSQTVKILPTKDEEQNKKQEESLIKHYLFSKN